MKLLNKKFLGILISLIFILIIINQLDINKTIKYFGLMNPLFILPIIPIYLSSFLFRAFRWKIFLSGNKIKLNSLLSSLFVGFSLNCVLPARAGELYRAYFFSKKENLRKTKVFTSVILERIFDGFILFLILLTVICLVYPDVLFFKIAISAVLIFFGSFTFLLILVKLQKTGDKRNKIKLLFLKIASIKFLSLKISKKVEKFINTVFSILNSFLEGLESLNSVSLLIKSVFYTCLIWLIEGTFIYLVIKSFGINISFWGALLVLTVTAFASLIPAGPASIGPYQWGYIIALKFFNIEPELALAVSIVNKFITIFLILSAGYFFIWKDHININKEKLIKEEELSWD